MNKISLESAKVSPKFESGELFSDEGVGVYMLCEISNKKWVAVSLIDYVLQMRGVPPACEFCKKTRERVKRLLKIK